MSHTEETLVLGDSKHLVATSTTPGQRATEGPPVVALLTNSGVIPRSGPNRMNVRLAREFAAMGIPSIRFDLSGLGDSSRPAQPKPMMAQWIADCQAIMDEAERRHGCNRFLMIGFCSGAEVAHLLALQDKRLRAALLWDMYAYPTLASRLRFLAFRLQRVGWMGSLHKVHSRVSRLIIPGSVNQPPDKPHAIPSSPPAKAELTKRLNALTQQGVILHFAFAEGNPHWFNHHGQFRAMFRGAAFLRHVSFRFLHEADHLMTSGEAQHAFMTMTRDWLMERVLPALNRRQ
jgi:pimeloyl-ACP methyl ester carboxylesterase